MNALEIRFSYPKVRIESALPKLQMEKRDTELSIHVTGPTLEVDNRVPFQELGMITLTDFSKENVAKGREAVSQGTLAYARLGDRYAREMVSQATVAQVAKEASRGPFKDLNVDLIPKSRPTITFHYDQKIDWRVGEVQQEVQVQPPDIQWQMGEVHITPQKGTYFDKRG